MKNQNEDVEKTKRRKEIFNLIRSGEYRTQGDIVEALKNNGIYAAQSTISRDIQEMDIVRGTNKTYTITDETLQSRYFDELQTLLSTNSFSYYKNVACHYMKVEKGKASLYAFHLQQAFPLVILDIEIRNDGLVILIDLDAEPEKMMELLAQY